MEQQSLEKGVNQSGYLNESSLFLSEEHQNLIVKNEELERELSALKSQLKRAEHNCGKAQKSLKTKEDYCEQVREWMARTIGIERVTSGC